MKVLLLVALLLACVYAAEWTRKTKVQRKEINRLCVERHPISKDMLSKLKKGDVLNLRIVQEFALCKALEYGIYNPEKEQFHVDRIVEQFNKKLNRTNATELVENCIRECDKNGKTDAEVVYSVYICCKNLQLRMDE